MRGIWRPDEKTSKRGSLSFEQSSQFVTLRPVIQPAIGPVSAWTTWNSGSPASNSNISLASTSRVHAHAGAVEGEMRGIQRPNQKTSQGQSLTFEQSSQFSDPKTSHSTSNWTDFSLDHVELGVPGQQLKHLFGQHQQGPSTCWSGRRADEGYSEAQ